MTHFTKFVAALAALCSISLTGCASSGRDYGAMLDENRELSQIHKVRIIVSGNSGLNNVGGELELLSHPPQSKKDAFSWTYVLVSSTSSFKTYYNIEARDKFTLENRDPSSYSYASSEKELPTWRAWRQWYWSVVQDSLLRLEAYGYTAKVDFLNGQGTPLETITTDMASPEPALQGVSSPLKYSQRARDIIESTSPSPN